jgi:hypothetical protein
MKDQSLKINQDWERESLKDSVYLWEQQMLLEQEFQKEVRQPATIVVIDTDHILDKKTHETRHYSLPF